MEQVASFVVEAIAIATEAKADLAAAKGQGVAAGSPAKLMKVGIKGQAAGSGSWVW